MVASTVASHLCRPLSLQLNQSATPTLRTVGACIPLAGLRCSPSSAGRLPYVPPSVATCSRSCRTVECSSGDRLGRALASPFSRRPLVKGFLKGLVGVMVIEGASGMSTGTPAASARARVSEVEKALKEVDWPEEFPFSAKDFERYDETPDTNFYASPRFVTHIDDYAIKALTKYYESVFPPGNTPGVAILDLCSSWISHFPPGYKQERIAGLGLNDAELKANKVLTEYVVRDLNVDPTLPYDDNSFDVIVNAVSVDYLKRPLEIFKEMHRVLKPGGLCAMSFSNRCFWTKAISVWTGTSDVDHVYIVGSYFHYTGGFEPPQALDISPNPGRSDPMYVVYSRKLAA